MVCPDAQRVFRQTMIMIMMMVMMMMMMMLIRMKYGMVTCSMGAGGVIAYVNKNTSPVICGRVIVPRGREILYLMQTPKETFGLNFIGLYATLFVGKPRGLRV